MLRAFILLMCLAPAADFSAAVASAADIQPQLNQLAKGDWIEQTQALEQLARIGDKAAVAAIRQKLLDSKTSAYLRGRALVALARLDGDAVANDAQAFAGSQDTRLRAATAEAYGYGTKEESSQAVAKGPLTILLKDKDPKVATAALVSWAKLYGKDAWAVVDPATKSLTTLPTNSPPELAWKFLSAMQALVYTGTPDAHERIDAFFNRFECHQQFGEPMLRGLVTTGRPSGMAMALRNIYKWTFHIRKPEGSFPRGRMLRSSDSVHQGLFAAIQRQGPKSVQAVLAILLQSTNPRDLELGCIVAAQLMPSPATGDLLLKACGESQDAYVEHRCVQALMEPAMEPARFASYFTKVLGSKHASSRIAAIDALVLCPDVNRYEAYAGIVEKGDAPEVLTAALEQLLSAPAKHLPREQIGAYFATAMADKDATVRNAATKLFKQAATRRDYPAVASDWESLLHSKDLQVRGTARKTIAMIASDDAQTELARNDGYLTEWQVLGTFRGETLARRTIAYPPETELDFSKTYQAEGIYVIPSEDKKIPPTREIRTRTIAWQKGTVTTVEGLLRVNYFVTPPTRQAIAYAAATVTPKTPGEAIIWVEGVQRQYLWLNGAKAIAPEPQVPKDKYLWLEKYPWRHHKGGTSGVRATYKVTLKPGPNQILIKAIYRGSTEWEFRVRVLGIDGSPLEVQQ
jgi:hypothetical protein